MTRKTRNKRADSDSLQAAQIAAKAAEKDILPPEGVMLDSEAEKTVWKQFVSLRAASDWRPFDLTMLAKVVRLEVRIRDAQAMLDKTGLVIQNKRGTPVANPLTTAIDTLQRQQMTVIRGMGLFSTGSDQRTIAEAGKSEAAQKEIKEADDVISLFGSPKQ